MITRKRRKVGCWLGICVKK